MVSKPLVSVITIFFNAQKFIEEAIQSVLAQTYPSWELLLVDDGSTDASTEIARGFAKQHLDKVRFLEHDSHKNRGMSASRNLGIRNAVGEYIAFLDADDVWLPGKLERQVPILESQPRVAMVYGPTQYWYSWTGLPEDFERDCVPDLGIQRETLFEPPALLTILYPLGRASVPCLCSLLVRSNAIKRIGGFEESFKGYYEDQAFLTKLYLKETIFVSDGCWDRYRIHSASCSAVVNQTGQYNSLRKHFLEWLKEYLRMEGVRDPKIWKVLNDELNPDQYTSRSSEAEYKGLRLLRVSDGNIANLVFPPDDADMVRIAITKAETRTPYDIQLNQPRLKVKAGHRYLINFLARTDSPRSICYGFAKGHAPWTNLGFYNQIELTSEWQNFEGNFIAEEDENNGRIHFDVGGSEVSVELSSVTLRNLSEGELVKPDLPFTQLGQRVPDKVITEPPVPFGKVEFGSLRRVTAISQDFGCDRGRPIDRYYIENFLECNKGDIQGRVLEVGDNAYTRKFGGDRVAVSDVLHVVEGEPQATIIADLASADHIPSNSFDCIILTQTLQLIYDVRAAIKTIYRILKPSGVLLATFPGISQTYDNEWSDSWYWNFTRLSARRLFEEVFPSANLKIETFGNVFAAISFLHGLAVQELTQNELDHRDPGYGVTITARAVKPASGVTSNENDRRSHGGRSSNSRGVILMYHRVIEGCSDPWGLCITPDKFAQQLEVLRRYTQVIRLQELVDAVDARAISETSVVVTFDDGYADNLINAKPLLERYGIPATIFLATGYLGGNREFWWDELDRFLLQPGTLPETLRLNINGSMHQWNLGDAAHYPDERWQQDRTWRAWENSSNSRHHLYASLCQLLQPLIEAERQTVLLELQAWANAGADRRTTHRTLSIEDVCTLARGELIEIGCHTVTHSILSALPLASQSTEIHQSKNWLEDVIGRKMNSFSYPYGSERDYTPETVSLVQAAGFACACSTIPTVVTTDSKLFELPRFQVKNWDGDEFTYQLSLWFDD